ncbi:MAG: nucleotidyl transferase AbiEii/AbiGii toxin family protein [Candidatus Omnitrophica bacterium]|nr:nucleotidyl transferase AbiEii/AbiGii toxin family protein [Candidatus Omnitrophota bacterium]
MGLLSRIQEEVLKVFGSISESDNFCLTGGTALAEFYLRHRKSNDLDFFSKEEAIIVPFSFRLEEVLRKRGLDIERRRSFASFVELIVKKENESTDIHLAQDSPFRFEEPKDSVEFPGVKIDSLVDIASNKLLALFGRATLRDFIDIFFLVKKEKFSPEDLMEKAKIKDPGFDLYWLGVALERINKFKKDSPELSLVVELLDFKEMLDFFNIWRQNISKQLY